MITVIKAICTKLLTANITAPLIAHDPTTSETHITANKKVTTKLIIAQ